jgi:PKD repeat protein
MKTSVFFRSMASSAIFFLFVPFSNGQDQISGNGNDPDKPGMTLSAKAGNIVPQLVDDSNSPIFPSLFVEPDGTAHLVYVANDKLMYAKRTRQTDWEYRTLAGCIGCLENDMVLDKNGTIHIVISDTRNSYPLHRLFHFRLTSGGQLSRRILGYDNGGFRSISLKTDSKNELRLVYLSSIYGSMNMYEMSTTNGIWSTPIPFGNAYGHADMEVDKGDNMQVSLYAVGPGIVYMKKNAGGTWSEIERVEPGWKGVQLEGMVTSIFTDIDQNPHISYVGQQNKDGRENIKYAWKKDGIWNISLVDKGSIQSAGNELVLDSDGKAHIAYVYLPGDVYVPRDLRYATNVSGTWVKQVVDEDIGALVTDMGTDLDKYAHIVYNGLTPSYEGRIYYALVPPSNAFVVDPNKLDFTEVKPGEQKTIAVKLINSLPENITVNNIEVSDARITVDRTSFVINQNSTETVNVTCKPTSALWKDTNLRIRYNDGLFIDIPVSATSWTPVLSVDQNPIDFGAIPLNTIVTKTVKITNTGRADLIISDINVKYTVFGQVVFTDFALVGHNCSTLQPGNSCDVQISFKPLTDKDQISYLNITSNDPAATGKIQIKGGTPYAQLSCNSYIDFGYCALGQSITKKLIIMNTGSQDLVITGTNFYGLDLSQFSVVTPCTTVQPGGSCDMEIKMSPTKTADLTASMSIISNSRYATTVTLKGSTILRELELSTNLIDFGEVPVGGKEYVQLELRNTGSNPVTISSIVMDGYYAPEFSQNYSCTTIDPGKICVDIVGFNPLFEGGKSASIVITSNDSDEPEQTVSLTGTGGPPLPLNVSISADHVAGTTPLAVQFNANKTGGQGPFSYRWNFNDGETSILESPQHTFTGAWIYKVSLEVRDILDNPITANIDITVYGVGIPFPKATANPVTGEIPLNVQFNCTVSAGDQPFTYLWEFRDGATSNVQNPAHTYSAAGSYWARVTVTDTNGDKGRDSVLVTPLLPNSLAGQIWDETGNNAVNKSTVILIPQAKPDDTTQLHLNGSNSYIFSGLTPANYTVLVVPDPVAWPNELPTYMGDKLTLFEATFVNVTGHITGKDIRLVTKPLPPPGSGSIEGSIVSGSKKGLTVTEKAGDIKGDPVQNTFVYLKRSSDGKLISYDISGSDGSFNFEGLENGSYTFVADCQGKPMGAANTPLVISDARKEIEILATVWSDRITVVDIATGTEDVNIPRLKVYPVPAGDHLVIEIPEGSFTGKTIRLSIIDLSGRHVFVDNKFELTGSPVTLDISRLKGGMYLLEAGDKTISRRVRIVKIQ